MAIDEKHATDEKIAVPDNTIRSASVSETIIKHSHDADEALKAFQGREGETVLIDEATNRRILRKVDLCILPIMCVCYGLNYLDKTTISYASIMGLQKDLSLVGDQYQWLGSLFYFGYLAFEFPAVRLLQWLPLGKFSGVMIILWGGILACFAAVVNFPGAVAIRFFLGLAESAISPGFTLLTSQWYTTKEQGSRTAIWFSFNGWGQILGGLVAYGISKGTDGVDYHGLAGWKIVFLLCGLLTMVMGIIFVCVIPDSPLNAWWLNKEDRILALERIRVNQQGVGNKHFKWYQLKEALSDPMTWAFFFYALISNIPNGGITNFFSQLIRSFGYTSEQSLLYGTPGGAVEVITLMASGFLGDRYGNRLLIGSTGLMIGIIGIVMIVALPLENSSGRLGGYYLTQAPPTAFVAILSLISSNVAGYTKKTTVAALYLIAYCAGNIIGPQTFRPQDAPRYVPGEITIIVCWCVALADVYFIYAYYRWQNAKKARARAEPGYVKLENQEWLDLTDRENPEFVYSL